MDDLEKKVLALGEYVNSQPALVSLLYDLNLLPELLTTSLQRQIYLCVIEAYKTGKESV